jgi:Nucleotidyl transferase AbiEii toxin, Type IV TA system
VSTIEPRLDCLPPAQRALWSQLSVIGSDFVLYGGTALALQVGGRISVDFDFFSPGPCSPGELLSKYPFLRNAELIQRELATASYSVRVGADDVKVSFFGTLEFGRVSEPVRFADNGIFAAGLLDLAAQKVKVVMQRVEAKDYLDVNTLMKAGITLEAALGAAKALYPQFNPAISLKALSYFEDVPKLSDEVRRSLTAAVANIRHIPEVRKQNQSLRPEGA